MNLYELATCGEDSELAMTWFSGVSTSEQLGLLYPSAGGGASVASHIDDIERRMHMLFVWWATR